jgi:general stress protein 26
LTLGTTKDIAMTTTAHELQEKFWKALSSDRTMMLGLDGVEDGHARPMTGQAEDDKGPIWFFTSTDNGIVERLGAGKTAAAGHRAIAMLVSKGHDLFATVHGTLSVDTDRAVIDRLWNPFVAAWYPGGKDDAKLRLLRLDTESAEIWLNESSIFAGLKMLLGQDPKPDYKDKVAQVTLN